MTDAINFDELKNALTEFAKARDWEKFHNPKNLSMAIAGEAGELLEIFQWLTEKESLEIKNNSVAKEQVGHEIADIILYATRLADILNVNLSKAIFNKLAINNDKYPTNKVKGSAKKYTEYLSKED